MLQHFQSILYSLYCRRASISGPVGKVSDDGRVHFRVEAQVQTDDIAVPPSVSNRWAHNHTGGHMKYYNFNEIKHAERQNEYCSDYSCETKL